MAVIEFKSDDNFSCDEDLPIVKKSMEPALREWNPLPAEKDTYGKFAEVFGNGDELKGFALLHSLTMRLIHARNKHPLFAEGAAQALGVIGAEYEELVHAVEHETPERQIDEALDVAVTAIRMVNGEHKTALGGKL